MFNIISSNISNPHIKRSLTKHKYYYVCNADMCNIPNNAKLVMTAFKNAELVSLTTHDYSSPNDEFYIFADFDFVIITVSDYNEEVTNIITMQILYKD